MHDSYSYVKNIFIFNNKININATLIILFSFFNLYNAFNFYSYILFFIKIISDQNE